MQGAEVQIRELQHAYPGTTIVTRSPAMTLLQAAHTTTLPTGEPCSVQLLVAVPSTFPQAPPRVVMVNGAIAVPFLSADKDDDDNEPSSDDNNNNNSNNSRKGGEGVGQSDIDDALAAFLTSSSARRCSGDGDGAAATASAGLTAMRSSSSLALDEATWQAARLSLVQVVRNALTHVVRWWGVVRPPDMATMTQQLRGETDQLLHDLATNPNCLDAYCYQLPTMKQMRDVATATVQQVDAAAQANQRLQSEVVELRGQVQQLQVSLQQQVDALKPLNNNKLLSSVASPQALLQTLEADVQALAAECRADGKRVLALHATDRRAFQEGLTAYRTKSARMHLLELKRSIYKAQLSH